MMPFLPIVLVGACTFPLVDIPFDTDADGLLDDQEITAGTDPDNPDSDEDSFEDGEEIDAYTDPTDPDDHPYYGGWDIGACRHDLTATGNGVGDVAEQFELVDQYAEILRLHDFCHKEVMIIYGAST